MLKPHGYLRIASVDGGCVERDTIQCGHCQKIVLVKPGSASTIYLYPQLVGPDREESGAHCAVCDSAVCLSCHDIGVCLPAEKMLELYEAIHRLGDGRLL